MIRSRLPPHLQARKSQLHKTLHKQKLQLAYAYAHPNDPFHPNRIPRAKRALIRTLLELHGSPELGPQQRPFSWGRQLQFMLSLGVDPVLQFARPLTYWEAAEMLTITLTLDEIDKVIIGDVSVEVSYAG